MQDNQLMITDSERRTICSYIEVFNQLYETFDLKIFAIGGTLLGACRDKKLIPWDDDVDYAIKIEDAHRLSDPMIVEFLRCRGFIIFSKRGRRYAHIWHMIKVNENNISNEICQLEHSDYAQIINHMHPAIKAENGICADIFGYQMYEGRYFLSRDGRMTQPIEPSCLSELECHTVESTHLYSMARPEDYLSCTYGHNWKRPSKSPRRHRKLSIERPETTLAIGVFDLLHPGHYNLLCRCTVPSGCLVVGVCSDRLVRSTKSRECKYDQYTRLQMIQMLDIVHKAYIYDDLDQSQYLLKYGIDVFVVPPDYGFYDEHRSALELCTRLGILVTRLDRTAGISTTQIRAILDAR